MTRDELLALVGKAGTVNAHGWQWPGRWTVVACDPGRGRSDDPAGDHLGGPRVCVETVERRVRHFADGRPAVTTEEPAERCESLPADWFVPRD